MRKCLFIEELRKLRESSKEAIEGVEDFSSFKKYMHIERPVEVELQKKLEQANSMDENKLIMVCGSVGDGKSHIISMLKSKLSFIESRFIIHNDATESHIPSKSFKEILDLKLEPFSDSNLNVNNNYKLILAINLGTLSNFIEDDYYSKKYSELRKYVYDNKIIENGITEYKAHQQFEYINFSDYKMYELTEGIPKSEFISELMIKIFADKPGNDFYTKYYELCTNCKFKEFCPVNHNYELLREDAIQNTIIRKIIEIQVKYKIILSSRSLLNFMYDLIVHPNFEQMNELEKLNELADLCGDAENYLKMLTPMLIFDNRDRSNILDAFFQIDPFDLREEHTDDMFIRINTLRDYSEIYDESIKKDCINLIDKRIKQIVKKNLSEEALLVFSIFMIRYSNLIDYNLQKQDRIYLKFMLELYYYNSNRIAEIKGLYDEVRQSILMWNGKAEDGTTNLFVGQKQRAYIISQEINIKAKPCNIISNSNDKFTDVIKLDYEVKGEIITIHIDYALYNLLNEVRHGYTPNQKDTENFISFIKTNKILQDYGNKDLKIKIKYKSGGSIENFILRDDDFGGFKFEKVN